MEDIILSEEEMTKSVMYYFTNVQSKLPVRKSDILKLAMNKQSNDFPDVIRKVAKDLKRIFGANLLGLKNGPKDTLVTCKLLEATSYITVDKFRHHILSRVIRNQTFSSDLVHASLFMILTCSYMMDKTLDEDTIWDILAKVEFAEILVDKKESLKRFLKSEFVDPLYLTRLDSKDGDQVISHYGWGVRSNLEFNKYAILKFAAESIIGKKTSEFVSHYAKISQEDIEKIDKEDEILRQPRRARTQPTQRQAPNGRDNSG